MLYSYRYIFAYSLIALFSAYFLFWQLGSIGPGLSSTELDLAATHTNARESLLASLHPLSAKLQILSLKIFGISTWSIRVPHLIISGATLLLLYQILKKWFGKPTSLLSVALVATADWFLFTARHATGAIELSFWLTLALLSIMKLLERKTIWALPLIVSLTCMVFVPFGFYIAATIVIGCLTCRVIRERLIELRVPYKLFALIVPLVSAGFLVYVVAGNLTIGKSLLGFTGGLPLTPVDYIRNAITNSASIVAVLPNTNPVTGPSGVFFVRFFELTFVLFGIFMFWKTRVNRLNLIVLSVAMVAILVSGFSNDSASRALLIVPFIIFITAGMRYFMHRWQKTFPKNPYARMAAFLPVILLLSLTAYLHYQSYFLLWPRQTATANAFSYQLRAAQEQLNKPGFASCSVVTNNESLITLLRESNTRCKPTFEPSVNDPKPGQFQLIEPTILSSYKYTTTFEQRALTAPNSESTTLWVVRSPKL